VGDLTDLDEKDMDEGGTDPRLQHQPMHGNLGKEVSEKSLSSKRFDRIHAEIAELIIEANRKERYT
jgi:hypothetical protein